MVKATDLNAWYLSVQPPSISELEKRLRARGTETEDSLQKRIAAAHGELEYAKEDGAYHETIVNDDLETAYGKFKAFINKGKSTMIFFLCHQISKYCNIVLRVSHNENESYAMLFFSE